MVSSSRSALWYLSAVALLSTFGSAQAHSQPSGTVHPLGLQTEVVRPMTVTRNPDGAFSIDFALDAFGQFALELPAPTAADVGRKMTVRLGERRSADGRLNPKPGGSIRFVESEVTLEAGKTAYRISLPKADGRRMPNDVGPVMPFRFAELENLPEGVTAEYLKATGARQLAVHYLFDDGAATFACSDEKLNAIWALSKHTIKATSFCGLFVDGDRERTPYEADAYINALGWYNCTTDRTLPRLSHEYLITHPTWPTEWIMFSDLLAWQDLLHGPDATSARAFYADLQAKTLRSLERDDGLISTTAMKDPAAVLASIHFAGKLKDIVDWPKSERDGCEMLPVNTVVNAFHARALSDLANVADAIGKPADAADLRRAAARTAKSLNDKLFDPTTGLYVDGEGSHHSSLHANVFPLAFGLVPPERRQRVLEFIVGRHMACSVYGAQFLLDALFDNGRASDAIALIEAPGDRSWRHMVEDVGTTLTLEAWDDRYKPNEDWNHAWGAAPANLLPRKVLGVEPLAPGSAEVLIFPRSALSAAPMLTWARGQVPTCKGPIGVTWKHRTTGFALGVDVPEGVRAELRLPPTWGTSVSNDGRAVAARSVDGTLAFEVRGPFSGVFSVGR